MQRKELTKKRVVIDASKYTIGIVVTSFHSDITEKLLEGAKDELIAAGVKESRIHIVRVYGSFEAPYAAQKLIEKKKVNAVVALGCIIKGETRHDEVLAHATTQGLMQVQLSYRTPVGLGVITTNTLAQAKARSSGKTNHGAQAARAALEALLT